MPTVNFYLKKAEGKPPTSLVYLQMRYHGQKFVYSCRFNVDPNDWDEKRQLVKTRSKTDSTGLVHLNTRLKEMREICIHAYNTESAKGIPTNSQLKPYLDAYMHQNTDKEKTMRGGPTLFGLINDFISGDIGDKKSPGTINTYRTAKKHLENFQTREGYPIDFNTINLDFKYKYTKYLGKSHGSGKNKEKALSPNSIAKEIKNVRTFMNMAVELGYTTNLAYKSKKFGVKSEETDAVYLTEKELRKLYKIDFSNDKRLEAVRDLFVFSSFVGLRYSDASNIKPENIVKIDGGKFIKVVTIKTGRPVTIPCNDIVLNIFKKYSHNKNHLPPAISNQKYNDYLKEVGEQAGLTETGRLASDLSKPLYQCLTSHTARRNFATNCYLAGMDSRMIMAVTGHSTEKSFQAYLKVSGDEYAKKMSEHMKKDLSRQALKAV
jgi:integrase